MTHTVDLVPDNHRVSQAVWKHSVVWVVVGAVAVFAVVLITFALWFRIARLEETVTPLRERVASMRPWENRVGPLTRGLQAAYEKNQVVGRLLVKPFCSELLSDLAQATSDQLWLTQVDITPQSRTEEEQKREVFVMSITGASTSDLELIRFMTALTQSEHVSGLDLEMSRAAKSGEGVAVVEFGLRADLQ